MAVILLRNSNMNGPHPANVRPDIFLFFYSERVHDIPQQLRYYMPCIAIDTAQVSDKIRIGF
jgi:hypothetical protein